MLVKIYMHVTIKSVHPMEGVGLYVLATEIGEKEVTLNGEVAFRENPSDKEYEMACERLASLITTKAAVNRLTEKCDALEVYTDSTYVAAGFQMGWIENWKSNGWKNARGETVAYAEHWKEIDEKLSSLKVKPVMHVLEHHPFKKWLESEAKKYERD